MLEFGYINKAAEKEFSKVPEPIKKKFLASFRRIQQGKEPLISMRPMVGFQGVYELRIKHPINYRSIYTIKVKGKVIVLHSFKKEPQGVDRKAMKTLATRLKLLD